MHTSHTSIDTQTEQNANRIKRVNRWKELIMTAAGALAGIGGVAWLAHATGMPFIIAPFGASAVLLYSATSSPLAQPRNLAGGHVISAIIAISCCRMLGNSWYVMALAVTLAILAMMITETVHPPGGATALLCVLQNTTSYTFLVYLLAGIVILLTAALLSACIFPGVRPYPSNWAPEKAIDLSARVFHHTPPVQTLNVYFNDEAVRERDK